MRRNLNAAFFAYYAAMLQALVLAAQALVVLDRAEDLRAEQAITLRLERAVVDRLGFFDFAERPRPNHVGRRQANANRIEVIYRVLVFKKLQEIFH
jgi:hypothetical protein